MCCIIAPAKDEAIDFITTPISMRKVKFDDFVCYLDTCGRIVRASDGHDSIAAACLDGTRLAHSISFQHPKTNEHRLHVKKSVIISSRTTATVLLAVVVSACRDKGSRGTHFISIRTVSDNVSERDFHTLSLRIVAC